MRTIQGVSVSAGIAIGTVRVLAAVDYAVERRLIDDPQAEMDRFRAARDTAVAQLKQLRDNVAAEFGENKAELFDAHRLMLQDPDYAECVEGLIAQDKVNAEFAVKSAAEQFAAGVCLLSFNFWNATYVMYGDSSGLANAANLGIIAAGCGVAVYAVLWVGLLVCIKKESKFNVLTRSWASFLLFFVIEIIALAVVLFGGLLNVV